MKSLLMAAALVLGLAAPALADDAASPPPPQTQAALAPSQEASVSPVPPQSEAVEVVPLSAPMFVPLESNAAPPARGGGCHHAKTTVYLTN